MKSLLPLAPQESAVLAACAAAATAEYDYVLKVVIAGQMLREYRDEMVALATRGKSSAWHDGTKPDEAKFSVWLEANGVASRTAYRWMDLADRVARLGLGINAHRDYATVIEIDGAPVALSQVLLTPEQDLTGPALKFQQGVLAFMEDKTLSEAMRAVADGASAGKRVTLAAGGMTKGGAGKGDRKAFEKFVAEHLADITSAVMVTQRVKGSSAKIFKERNLAENQRSLIRTAFIGAMKHWPRWLIDSVLDSARAEAKLSDHERNARRSAGS